MIYIIDHQDSFTWNVVHQFSQFDKVYCSDYFDINKKLLNNMEKESRNIFTGSFGYIKSNGNMRFNIIIRSLLNYKNICEISVASGIILGSAAKKEYQENYIKAKSLLDIFKP